MDVAYYVIRAMGRGAHATMTDTTGVQLFDIAPLPVEEALRRAVATDTAGRDWSRPELTATAS